MIDTDIVIIGTGFSGLAAAIKLREAGRHDLVILEKADEVGGTWRENTYPGAACDVQSHLYSLSFALNPDWTHEYSGWEEIGAYLRKVADDFGLRPHIAFNTEVGATTWDDKAQRWTITTNGETYRARVIFDCRGFLHIPSIPKLPGADDFAGPTIHSARWDHDVDLAGKNVAVIGTGASAIQIVPAIADTVSKLSVYQRSAAWTVPRMNYRFTRVQRFLFRLPGGARAYRTYLFWLQECTTGLAFKLGAAARLGEWFHRLRARRAVDEPAVAEALIPDYTIGCKRALRTDEWLPTFNKPNVELVTTGIGQITKDGIVDKEGTLRPADVIVYGTGFHVADMFSYKDVTGRDKRNLAKISRTTGDETYYGQIAGFPNYFVLVGPNTNQGYTSTIIAIEAEVGRFVEILDQMDVRGAVSIEPTPEAQRAHNERLQKKLSTMVWSRGGCSSWYLDENGVNRSIWPGSLVGYRRHLKHIDPNAYSWRTA